MLYPAPDCVPAFTDDAKKYLIDIKYSMSELRVFAPIVCKLKLFLESLKIPESLPIKFCKYGFIYLISNSTIPLFKKPTQHYIGWGKRKRL